jgi:hypothetical protein
MHPLSIFIESLRADGFKITVHDYHRINFALEADNQWNLKKLRGTLMALLAKTPEQGVIFQQRFEAFFNVPESSLIVPLQPIPTSPDTPSQSDVEKVPASLETEKNSQPPPDFSQKGKFKRWLKKWIDELIALLVLVLYLVIVIGYYSFYRPQLVLAPTELVFDQQFLGTQSKKTFKISNLGFGSLTISPITLSETDAFEIITDNCSGTRLSRSQCTIEIQFLPKQESNYTATLTIPNSKRKISRSVSGSGIHYLQPKQLIFGEQRVDTPTQKTIDITNSGSEPITINQVTLNDDTNAFNILTDKCKITLAAEEKCPIAVQFTPKDFVAYTATLTILDSIDTSRQISLRGTGNNPISIQPDPLVFGEQAVSTTTQKIVDIINSRVEPITINQLTLGDTKTFNILTDSCSNTTLVAKQPCRIAIQFAPSDVTDYTTTLTVTVDNNIGKTLVSLSGTGTNQVIAPWKIYAILTAILFFGLLIYGFWLWRSRQLPEDIPPVWQFDKPRLFSLGTVGGKPQPRLSPKILDILADSIGYFQSTQPSETLDLDKTVHLSIERRLPTLVFQRHKQLRTVLILEDGLAKPLVWNPIAKELATGLEQRGVPVLYGQFYGSYQEVCTTEGVCYNLKTLAYDLDSYVLLIFSDGKSLRYHKDAPTLKSLAEWYQAAWLELREVQAWDESTALPAHFGLPIYPATPDGLLQAIGRFLSEAGQQNELSEVVRQARGFSMRIGENLAAYLEEFLGDALPWAQSCAMIQPVSLGLAEALCEKFFGHLPAERIERLFTLPNTSHTANGLSFSQPILATLRAGFLRRFTEEEQEERLQFILEKLSQVEPEDKESPAHLAWEWYWQRVNLELNPDEALQRLAELAGTHLGDAIRTELEGTVPPPEEGTTTASQQQIPLRLRPKNQVALQRLRRLAKHSGIPKLSVLPVGIGHWIITGVFVTAFLGTLVFSVLNYETLEKQLDPETIDIGQSRIFRDRLQDGSEGPEMVWIPAGDFQMGGSYSSEKPVHQVSVSAFAMGRYEVTFEEYDRFAEATGREKPGDEGWGRGNRPVINVSWNDATAYMEWLSTQTGKKYRLPTEAEWEYAARAGTDTKYWWGNEVGSNQAACDGCGAELGLIHSPKKSILSLS